MNKHKPRSNIAKALSELNTSSVYHGLIREIASDYNVSESSLAKAWRKFKRVRDDAEQSSNPILVARAARKTRGRRPCAPL